MKVGDLLTSWHANYLAFELKRDYREFLFPMKKREKFNAHGEVVLMLLEVFGFDDETIWKVLTFSGVWYIKEVSLRDATNKLS